MASTDFTVADVLAWARTKPADEQFDYGDADKCAIAQFGRDTGRAHLVGLLSAELRAVCGEQIEDAVIFGGSFRQLVYRLEALDEQVSA